MPFERSTSEHDPVLQRLRKMRERSEKRDESQLANLYDIVKAGGRNGRLDWWHGKMRWFVGGIHSSKFKANMAVEQSMGEQPDLWSGAPRYAVDSNAFQAMDLTPEKQWFNSKEYSKMPSLDPLLDAEREFLAMSKTGEHNKPKMISCDPAAVVPIEDKKGSARRLRLLEIHHCKRDIEELAEEVVDDIKLICMDDYRAIEEHPEPALQNLAAAAAEAAAQEDNEVPFIAPPVEVAVWG